MREFFGFGGYEREPEGYFSWQHLLFVTSLIVVMIFLSILLGLKNRNKDEKGKNKVLILSAILIDAFELFKIIIFCVRSKDPFDWINNLPLFLCSIQLITIPLAAFSKGKIKEACLDFVFLFGIVGAILGTYGAGNNYGAYPVLSVDNVVSGITHCISGFTSLYIVISGMQSMKKENIKFTFIILVAFCIMGYVSNLFFETNYMFLMSSDGTPYEIFYNLFNGNKILYPLSVILLFFIYIVAFYYTYYFIIKLRKKGESI